MSRNSESRSGPPSWLLLGLIPALITGIATLTPKIYDVLTQPRVSLNYQLDSGLALNSGAESVRIASFTIKNSGTKSATDLKARLVFPNAEVRQFAATDGDLLAINVEAKGSTVLLNLPALLPGEEARVGFLIQANASGFQVPTATVRSAEAVGSHVADSAEATGLKGDFGGAFIAALSVFVMFVTVLWDVRRGSGSRFSIFVFGIRAKEDVIRFIAARAGLYELATCVTQFRGMTYLEASDHHLALAIAKPELAEKCILASKALLLVEELAAVSRDGIYENIRAMQGQWFDQETLDYLRSRAVGVQQTSRIRREIERFIGDEDAYILTAISEVEASRE